MKFLVSDESLNRQGFRILTAGIDTAQFERNPVMLYDHERSRLPIGSWKLEREGNKLYAVATFDEKDDFALSIKNKVDGGFIRMTSIAAMPIEVSSDPTLMLPGQELPTVTRCELREISIAPFGANYNALKLCDMAGTEIQLSEFSKNQLLKDNKMNTLKDTLSATFALKDASEADIVRHVITLSERSKSLESENATLKSENERMKTEAANAEKEVLLSDAEKAKKITATEKTALIKLSVEDIKAVLAERKGAVNLGEFANSEKPDANSPLLKLSWRELDRSGKLEEVKQKYPDYFAELKKQHFGV